jgi:hypothetical protein
MLGSGVPVLYIGSESSSSRLNNATHFTFRDSQETWLVATFPAWP